MKFSLYTLGCKVNQYESECIIQAWKTRGLEYTTSLLHADIIVINSCAVTEKAIKDIQKCIRMLHKASFLGEIILTGCATKLAHTIDFAGIRYTIIAQEDKEYFYSYSFEKIKSERFASQHDSFYSIQQNATQEQILSKEEQLHSDAFFNDSDSFILTSSLRARATVKIHDGCSHRCTYCIIPYTRGTSKSRSISDIIKEIRNLLHAGHREIILSGINLRQFGSDLTFPIDFWDLIKRLQKEFASEWTDIARFRISSLEPCQLDEKAFDILAHTTLICPHLHISLQSASDIVLKNMARSHYSAHMLYDAIQKVSSLWKIFALGVDIITGFPSETEQEFLKTKDFLQEIPVTYAHIFPFSERPFTKAPTMPNQVYPHIRKQRADLLRSLVTLKQHTFLEQLVIEKIEQSIIPEKYNKTIGISQYYVECRSEIPFADNGNKYIPIANCNEYIQVE